jgi:dynein intermediate chain 1
MRLIDFQNLETQTIPPPRSNFSGQVMQWIIYDAYQQDFEAQQREKEKEKKDKVVPTQKPEVKRKDLQITSDTTNRTLLAIKTLERMINQNTYDEIAQGV